MNCPFGPGCCCPELSPLQRCAPMQAARVIELHSARAGLYRTVRVQMVIRKHIKHMNKCKHHAHHSQGLLIAGWVNI